MAGYKLVPIEASPEMVEVGAHDRAHAVYWRMVDKAIEPEPTAAMIDAGYRAQQAGHGTPGIFKAMLAAAKPHALGEEARAKESGK